MMLFARTQTPTADIRIWYTPDRPYKIVCERRDGVNHWRLSELKHSAWTQILAGTGDAAQEIIMQALCVTLYSKGEHPAPESTDPYHPPETQFAIEIWSDELPEQHDE